MTTRRVAGFTAAVVLVSACASGGGGVAKSRASRCMPITDSALVAAGPVYRECEVDQRATLITQPRIDFQPRASVREPCFRAEFEVVVDERGNVLPETVRWIRVNDGSFQEAIQATLSRWKYQPATKGGYAVRQLMRGKYAMVLVRSGAAPPTGRPSCT